MGYLGGTPGPSLLFELPYMVTLAWPGLAWLGLPYLEAC
jgi:hypothetical protein